MLTDQKTASSHDPARAHLGWGELVAQYDAYRERQARLLIRMLPRGAVRPLYRRAIDAFGKAPDRTEADPMAALLRYCEELLPLPSFEVWYEDLRRHPIEHLRDLHDSPLVPTVDAPLTAEARPIELRGESWVALLRLFRHHQAWRGFISFERSDRVHRTAVIFHGDDPAELRERFVSFESGTLIAFLRSALP